MASDIGLLAGIIFLVVVLVAVIILGVIAFCWIVGKLRQHEKDILRLKDLENGTVARVHKPRDRVADSAIELNDIDPNMVDRGRRPLSQVSEISNRSKVRARMTLFIQKEQTNVYGHLPPLDQVLMTAQHYYKTNTKSNVDIPVESVKIVDKDSNKRSAISRVLTEDWKEGVPTSILFQGNANSFDEIFSQNKGVFVHKNVGPTGGHLKISGVDLVIPPNALEEDRLISLGVIWDEKFTPPLSQKQSMLSPVILCQPNGLKFKTPVRLTFPHAAFKVTSDWIPKILKREGALNENRDWIPITLADYEERNVNDRHISLKLNHFTLYTCIGESKPGKMAAKHVQIVAFAGNMQRASFFKPRIYCLNKYEDEIKEVEKILGKIDPSSKISETTGLFIHDNGQDVLVEMAKLADDWNLAGDRTEVLPFEQVWHALHPHCTFIMKPKKSTVSEIYCEIHAYQNGADNQAAKLKIAEQMSLPQSPLSSTGGDPHDNLIKELIILLDPQSEVNSDWRNLAEKMDCGLTRIRWLGTQSSPTQVLLEKWLEDGKTFKELENVMKEIHREDAAEEIRKLLKECEQTTDS